jgi:hypothetical protein
MNKINIIKSLSIPLNYTKHSSKQHRCTTCDKYIKWYYHFGEYNIYRYEYYYSEHEDKKYCDYKYFVCNDCISFKNKDYDNKLQLIDYFTDCESNKCMYILEDCSVGELCNGCIKSLYYDIDVCEKCKYKTKIYNNRFYLCVNCYNNIKTIK